MQTKVDLLEADKSTAEAAAEAARTELAEFKAEIERSAQVAELKNTRKSKVQEANASLSDDFFSDERVTRWAEMSEEAFDAFVLDMTEMAKATKPVEEKTTSTKELARESAAFAGGTAPSVTESSRSALGSLLAIRHQKTA